MSTPALTDKQRHHRKATSDAMKRMSYRCPSCSRGQNKNPIDVAIGGPPVLLWRCVYCGHEWDAGSRRRLTPPPPASSATMETDHDH